MNRYCYVAIDAASGRRLRGEITGADEAAAIAGLHARGLFPISLAADGAGADPAPVATSGESSVPGRARWRRRIGGREVTIFTRQLAALVTAGMPLVRGLDLLARQERNPRWRAVIRGLADGIRAGGTLSDGLARHPRIFDRMCVGLVRAGETGGTLELVLERLAKHREQSGRTRARLLAATAYPIVIMAVAATIVAALLVFVVPRFEAIFAGVLKGAPLPALTQAVLGGSRWLGRHWLALGGGALALAAGLRWLGRTAAGARIAARWSLRLPLAGPLILKAATARLARTLGTMLAGGVPILDALQLAGDACGQREVAAAADLVRRRVREGEGMARPLAATGVFPPVVAGMIEVGEETGTLPAMLARLADLYDDEVDNAVTALTSLLEPAMIVAMALVVGTIVIALFLPIVRIVQLLGG
ncbi:MAG TPA: type II secretion system F family protein [Opitutaceae bacterium]|nr:type II secretion system F family protein [Opitutaceae bacterium]